MLEGFGKSVVTALKGGLVAGALAAAPACGHESHCTFTSVEPDAPNIYSAPDALQACTKGKTITCLEYHSGEPTVKDFMCDDPQIDKKLSDVYNNGATGSLCVPGGITDLQCTK